jgi:predicted nucleic acid-binding protein
MEPRFLDTNVLLRYFTRDDDEKAEAALALLTRVEQGEERIETLPTVIFETVFTLQRFYGVARPRIRELLLPVLRLRGLHLPGKNLLEDALDLYAQRPRLSFADAYHAVYLRKREQAEVYSWDTDFDGLAGITRIEPGATPEEPTPPPRSTLKRYIND